MCFQHKAVMIFERVLGVDHPDTVAAYVSDSKHFDMYCLASKIENLYAITSNE